MTPTKSHYFYAGNGPVVLWMGAFVAVFTGIAAVTLWPLVLPPCQWLDVLAFAGMVLLMALTGWFCAILSGWFVPGPLLYDRGLRNGRPFQTGDEVLILCGKHRDRIAEVAEVYDDGVRYFVYVKLDAGTGADASGGDGESAFHAPEILLQRRCAEPEAGRAAPAN